MNEYTDEYTAISSFFEGVDIKDYDSSYNNPTNVRGIMNQAPGAANKDNVAEDNNLECKVEDIMSNTTEQNHTINSTNVNIESAGTVKKQPRRLVNWDDETQDRMSGSDYIELHQCKMSPAMPAQVIIYDNHAEDGFTHKYEFKSYYNRKQTYICPENNCPLCIIKMPRYPRMFQPVFNMLTSRIEVLQYMKFNEVGSLYPLMKEIIKKGNFPMALAISMDDNFNYTIEKRKIPDSLLDCGLQQYKEFKKYLEDNDIYLGNIFNSIDEELLSDSKIQRLLAFNNHDPSDFYVENDFESSSDMFDEYISKCDD